MVRVLWHDRAGVIYGKGVIEIVDGECLVGVRVRILATSAIGFRKIL